jgi:RHS repeat-associated protein
MTNSVACATIVRFSRSRYTGKERDAQTGLDYFGARYYGSSMGRFMSPDWSSKPVEVPYADLGNPQTLNLYSYVRNNPLTEEDPDGHALYDTPAGPGTGDNDVTQQQDKNQQAQNTQAQTNPASQNQAQQQNGNVSTAEKYLSKSKTMRSVLRAFKSGHFHLSLISDGNDRYDPTTRTVYWDPDSALETTDGGHQTPALGLGHEMAHATGNRHMTAELSGMADPQFDTREERRVISELRRSGRETTR